jgi:sugar-specific transcriptional regulator TrmB
LSLTEKAMDALEALGLTKTEIRAYLALLDRGTMNASEISAAARIPYSKVYQALESLHRDGCVDVQRSRPVLYTAKPPESAMEELRSRHESTRRDREQIALKELVGIYEKREQLERPEIWLLRGTNEIISKVKNTVLDSKNELLIAMPAVLAPFTKQIVTLLAMAKEKGVKNQIMTSFDAPAEVLDELARVAEVRARETMFGGGVIADGKEVVLLLGGESNSSSLAIWADHPGLAGFARGYFEFLWSSPETTKRNSKVNS